MRIGLLPLDERPVNTRYPAMIAAIAGAELRLPPAGALSARRRPADCAALAAWLEQAAPALDGLIVSLELLGYGGLIASRISHEPAATILGRLELLRSIRQRHPQLPIYAFSVISRVSNANDALEEPAYWAVYGERLYAYSQLLDRQGQGQAVGEQLAALETALPAAHRRDFLARRLRNHGVNIAALHMLAEGCFDLLVLSSDDTSPFGLPARERRWLSEWADLLGLAAAQGDRETGRQGDTTHHLPPTTHQLLMYPGADEVGCALVARLLNWRAGVAPSVAVSYAPPEAAANVAAYEDQPVRHTVKRQIAAIGGLQRSGSVTQHPTPNTQHPDIWLGVNAPLARRSEWAAEHAEAERAARLPALAALLGAARQHQAAGRAVALADVAYPNGADPALVELLLAELDLPSLAAYGAWNTAGNTIGTALAQASAAQLISSEQGRAAQEIFLLHRFVEDWGYQQIVRGELRAWLRERYGSAEPPSADASAETAARAERRLNEIIASLPGFAGRFRLAHGSVSLPWGRTFEIDFTLEPLKGGGSAD
jgi:hypothetical protein